MAEAPPFGQVAQHLLLSIQVTNNVLILASLTVSVSYPALLAVLSWSGC